MLRILSKTWRTWQSSLFPYTCILCHTCCSTNQDLCDKCFNELPILPQSCKRCANTLEGNTTALICGKCLLHPPPFDAMFALFDYAPPIPKLILDLKFQANLIHAHLLGEWMAHRLKQRSQPLPDLILPVPLHHQRLTSRGFNQSVEIAKPIARTLGLKLDVNSVVRIKATQPQAMLKQSERLSNLQNAFQAEQDLTGLHIAIVDDVITTGQTVSSLSEVLRAKGAAFIEVWACAKTQQNSI